ncbi:Uncharacterised protein [Serratia quinivorans]|nr:Uncharacterised protein [Serratia quinivorans]
MFFVTLVQNSVGIARYCELIYETRLGHDVIFLAR